MLILQRPLLALYDVTPGEAGSLAAIAYDTARTRILFLMLTCPLMAIMDAGCGVLRGLGRSLLSTAISLVGVCAFRIAWIYTAFRAFPTLEVLYASYPISWALTAAAQLTCVCLILHNLLKRSHAKDLTTRKAQV